MLCFVGEKLKRVTLSLPNSGDGMPGLILSKGECGDHTHLTNTSGKAAKCKCDENPYKLGLSNTGYPR